MNVRTLRDVNIVKCIFSMIRFLISRITLNQVKGPNEPIFVFNYSCMVRQHVLEALEDVWFDLELIKYEQKTTNFFTLPSSFNRPLRNFFWSKLYQKDYGTLVTFMERGVDVETRAWVLPFCCNNGDQFWSKAWSLRGKDGFFTSCFPFSCPRPPSKLLSHRV